MSINRAIQKVTDAIGMCDVRTEDSQAIFAHWYGSTLVSDLSVHVFPSKDGQHLEIVQCMGFHADSRDAGFMDRVDFILSSMKLYDDHAIRRLPSR